MNKFVSSRNAKLGKLPKLSILHQKLCHKKKSDDCLNQCKCKDDNDNKHNMPRHNIEHK